MIFFVHNEQNITQLTKNFRNYTLEKKFKKIKKMIAKREFSASFVIMILVIAAALGGGINFVLSQGYLNSVQASNLSGVETILFLGYDATDNDSIIYHDGVISNSKSYWHGNKFPDGINRGERIGVYVQNNSAEKITLKQVKLGKIIYSYQEMRPKYQMTPYSMDTPLNQKEYAMVKNGNQNAPADTIEGKIPELKPGQKATIVLELDQSIKIARDIHFEITTDKGGVFVHTILSGQESM